MSEEVNGLLLSHALKIDAGIRLFAIVPQGTGNLRRQLVMQPVDHVADVIFDVADVEILLDEFRDNEILMTMGKVKEAKRKVSGRAFAFSLELGVKIINFRELRRCTCNKGWTKGGKCTICYGTGYIDKEGT